MPRRETKVNFCCCCCCCRFLFTLLLMSMWRIMGGYCSPLYKGEVHSSSFFILPLSITLVCARRCNWFLKRNFFFVYLMGNIFSFRVFLQKENSIFLMPPPLQLSLLYYLARCHRNCYNEFFNNSADKLISFPPTNRLQNCWVLLRRKTQVHFKLVLLEAMRVAVDEEIF